MGALQHVTSLLKELRLRIDLPLTGEDYRRPRHLWRSRPDNLQSPHQGGLDVFVVLVSPTRSTVKAEDRFEGIAQGDSRVRLGDSGQRPSQGCHVPNTLLLFTLLLNFTVKLASFLSHFVTTAEVFSRN